MDASRGLAVLSMLQVSGMAITATGIALLPHPGWSGAVAKLLLTYLVIGLVYLFNDAAELAPHRVLRSACRSNWVLAYLAATTVATAASAYYLSVTSLAAIAGSLILGISYSLEFRSRARIWCVRRVFILKNIFIGCGWGLLIYFGANSLAMPGATALSVFVMIQVFIGSVIRDIDDVLEDQNSNTSSLPIRLGVPRTLSVLQGINGLSLLALVLLVDFQSSLFVVKGAVPAVVWRFILLHRIGRMGAVPALLQKFNLFTCFVIFLSVFIARWL